MPKDKRLSHEIKEKVANKKVLKIAYIIAN